MRRTTSWTPCARLAGTEVNVGALGTSALPNPTSPEAIQFIRLVRQFQQECVADYVSSFGSNEVPVPASRTFPKVKNCVDCSTWRIWFGTNSTRPGQQRAQGTEARRQDTQRRGRIRGFLTAGESMVSWIKFDGDNLTYTMPYYVGDVMSWLAQRARTTYRRSTVPPLATPDLALLRRVDRLHGRWTDGRQVAVRLRQQTLIYVPRSSDPGPKDKEFGGYPSATDQPDRSQQGRKRCCSLPAVARWIRCTRSWRWNCRAGNKLTVLHQDRRTANQELVRQFQRQTGTQCSTLQFFEGVSIGLAMPCVWSCWTSCPSGPALGEAMLRRRRGAFEQCHPPQMLIITQTSRGAISSNTPNRQRRDRLCLTTYPWQSGAASSAACLTPQHTGDTGRSNVFGDNKSPSPQTIMFEPRTWEIRLMTYLIPTKIVPRRTTGSR